MSRFWQHFITDGEPSDQEKRPAREPFPTDGEALDVGEVADRLEDHVHARRPFDVATLADMVQGMTRRAEDLA